MTAYIQWLRAQVGQQKIFVASADAIIADEKGRVLLQRRADLGVWGLPGGGMDLGERIDQTIAREVREETGLQVKPTRLVGLYTSPEFDWIYPNGNQAQFVSALFECRKIGGTLRADGGETLDLGYFALDALPPMDSIYQAQIADWEAGHPGATFRSGAPGPLPWKAGNYIGWLRRHVGQARVIMTGACGYIPGPGGRVLAVRRGDNGLWGMPAGAMELGERIDQTIVREIYEETGLQVEPTRLIGLYTGPEFAFTYPNGDRVQIFSAFFDCRVVGGTLRPDGVESLEVAYVDPATLPPYHRLRVADARREQAIAIIR